MRVVEAGNDAASTEVDDGRFRPCGKLFGIVDTGNAIIRNHKLRSLGMLWIKRGDTSVFQDEAGFHRLFDEWCNG